MNDSSFCKSFHFNVFKFNRYHLTDNSKRPVPLHYFGCLIRGTADIISKNGKISLKPKEVFYIPKGLKYQSKWYVDDRGGVEFYSFGFEFAPIDKPFILQKITCTETAAKLFEELCCEIPITDKGIGKLYSFFGEVAESLVQSSSQLGNTVVENAVELLTRSPNSKISDIAKGCNVSESSIFNLFKKHLNKSPNQVRLEILCEKAVYLLTTTNKPVQEISDILEFSSTSYFRKVLQRYTGKTPREIRKQSEKI